MQTGTRQREFWAGVRDEAPILLGVAPFGLIFGAAAAKAGLPDAAAQAMSSIIFAGSAQFVAAQLFGSGAAGLVIITVIFVVNLRHALYSASVAPYIQNLSRRWRFVLAYLLTDECYAVTISHFQRHPDQPQRHWYYLGAGLVLWACWQATTALGILLGAQVPQDWPLGFVLPLTFIALVVPALRDRAAVTAALVAGIAGLLLLNLPLKTGLLLASLLGIVLGMLLEARRP